MFIRFVIAPTQSGSTGVEEEKRSVREWVADPCAVAVRNAGLGR